MCRAFLYEQRGVWHYWYLLWDVLQYTVSVVSGRFLLRGEHVCVLSLWVQRFCLWILWDIQHTTTESARVAAVSS